MRQIIDMLINKAKYLENLTISENKNKLTTVDENSLLFRMNETLGMARISQFVEYFNNKNLDVSAFPLLTCISSRHFIQIFFIILLHQNILYIDKSMGEPILMLDDSKKIFTYNDIIHNLLHI